MSNFEIDISKLSGEELLDFDGILTDIIAFNSDDYDETMDILCGETERLHERWYHEYEKAHNYHAQSGMDYDDNKAWMHAQIRIVNSHINQLDNEKISNFFMCRGGIYGELEEVWNKCVTETEDSPKMEYNYGDIYDFSSWEN